MSFSEEMHLERRPYNDSILTITHQGCPDPYVYFSNDTYFMTFTQGGHIEIWSSDSLFDFESRCEKHVIWRPPPDTEYSSDLWAPELHSIQGKWWVYFAANHPQTGNKGHRMFVLEGPGAEENPCQDGRWEFKGRVEGMPHDQWAIDGTVLTLHGQMLFVYSGWPLGISENDTRQELFIMRMESPTAVSGHPIRISTPDMQFEYSGLSGINEGPQFLCSPDGRWAGIVYSCAGSWTHEYKMNLLYFTGGDPLDPTSWAKSNRPLLQAARDDSPPYGPGHGNFILVNGPSGNPEVWAVFHATDQKTGWEGRKARIMRVGWAHGGPYMGSGECGRCCGVTEHFLLGCPGGECGAQGHCGGVGGPQGEFVQGNSTGEHGDYKGDEKERFKREVKNLVREGKGLISNFFR